MLSEYLFSGLQTIKQYLVGDFQLQDIYYLYHSYPPSESIKLFNGVTDTTSDDEIVIKGYGLLGRLLRIPNIAYMKPQAGSTLKITNIMHFLDSLPDSRKLYTNFDIVTGSTPVISQTGEKGNNTRKQLVRVLPTPHQVHQTCLRILNKSFANITINPKYFFDNCHRSKSLVREILVALFLGCDFTPEMNEAIDKMTTLVLMPPVNTFGNVNHRKLASSKRDYTTWVHKSLTEVLSKADQSEFCTLAKYIKQLANNNATKPSIDDLEGDPMIHTLFTMISTAENINTLLNSIVFNLFKVQGGETLARLIKEIEEKQFNLDEIDFDKIRSLESLDNIYQFGLYISHFMPEYLLRYIQHDTEVNGTIIPGNTQLVIHHSRNYQQDQENNIPDVNELKPNTELSIDDFVSKIKPLLDHGLFSAFAMGARSCPGQLITRTIFKTVILKIVQLNATNKDDDYRVTHASNCVL